jgi:hypothetical protein
VAAQAVGPLGAAALAAGALLMVVAVVLIVRRWLGGEDVRALRRAVRRARRDLRRARRARARALAPARAAVRRERRRWRRELEALEARVRSLEDPRGRLVAVAGPVLLHERVVVTPAGTAPVAGARAEVATSGSIEVVRRPTLTRAALGAAAFGTLGAIGSFAVKKRETHDTRRVHLLIDAGDASVLVELGPGDERAAVRLADALGVAADRAPAAEAARLAALGSARSELASARSGRGSLDAAIGELDRLEADAGLAGPVAVAEARLEDTRTALRHQAERDRSGRACR